MRSGGLIYAQLWCQPEFAVFGSTAPLAIPPDKKVEVIELRKKLRKKIAKQNRNLNADDLLRYSATIRAVYLDIRDALHAPLRLANTDGDPLIFHTLTFRIETADAAFDALAPLAVGLSPDELLNDCERDESAELRTVSFDMICECNHNVRTWDAT